MIENQIISQRQASNRGQSTPNASVQVTAVLPGGIALPATARVFVSAIIISASGPGTSTVQLRSNGTIIVNFGSVALTTAPSILPVNAVIEQTPTGSINVLVGAAGAGVTTDVSLIANLIP